MSDKTIKGLVDKLEKERNLSDEGLSTVLFCEDEEAAEYLAKRARAVREKAYGKDVYIRGLIEFSNYCRNDCNYCGIRRSNSNAKRYRITEDEIISCTDRGHELGFRTFVLQSGEDPFFTKERIINIVGRIKERHPDSAVTLSIGEWDRESYQQFFDVGADRFLLRHETADREHYATLHPESMSFDHRMQCLKDLKEIGYQVGCGMMVGSPGQKQEHLIKDLRFIQEFRPHMVGMGPFIPHHDTEYAGFEAGSGELTLRLLSVIRLMMPEVLLPATTALGTVDPRGRERGLLAGANVVMPNLSPVGVRKDYSLYDNKICTGDEAAECIRCLSQRVESCGYRIVESRGDCMRGSVQ